MAPSGKAKEMIPIFVCVAGKYSLSLRNDSGSDSAKVEIKVLDRPAAPEGLTATVEGTTCALLWKKSKDDGGAPIVHYQVLI